MRFPVCWMLMDQGFSARMSTALTKRKHTPSSSPFTCTATLVWRPTQCHSTWERLVGPFTEISGFDVMFFGFSDYICDHVFLTFHSEIYLLFLTSSLHIVSSKARKPPQPAHKLWSGVQLGLPRHLGKAPHLLQPPLPGQGRPERTILPHWKDPIGKWNSNVNLRF